METSPLGEVFQVLWLALALVLNASSSPKIKIAVLDVAVRGNLPADLGQVLSDALVSEVRKRRPRAAVISAEEIRSMLQIQSQKQRLGCSSASVSCLAEIGGALGADRMVVGTLGKLGKVYVYSLKILDVNRALVMASASMNVPSTDDEALLGATTSLVGKLLPEEAAPPAPPAMLSSPASVPPEAIEPMSVSAAPAPAAHSHLGSVLLGVGALACAGVAVYGLTRVLQFNGDVSNVNAGHAGAFTAAQYQSDKSAGQLWQPLGLGLAVLAAAGVTGAVLTW